MIGDPKGVNHLLRGVHIGDAINATTSRGRDDHMTTSLNLVAAERERPSSRQALSVYSARPIGRFTTNLEATSSATVDLVVLIANPSCLNSELTVTGLRQIVNIFIWLSS